MADADNSFIFYKDHNEKDVYKNGAHDPSLTGFDNIKKRENYSKDRVSYFISSYIYDKKNTKSQTTNPPNEVIQTAIAFLANIDPNILA